MDTEKRIKLITRGAVEVITKQELRELVEAGVHMRGYIGVEPSGLFSIAWMIWVEKLRDFISAGIDMTVLLATWHAMVNDKLGGDIENIRKCARYIQHCISALGVEVEKISFVTADRLIEDPEYWTTLLRISRRLTLARVKRALTILGRRVGEREIDFAKFIYPSMQVTDIFMLNLNICLGGEDQRRAHVLAREIAQRIGRKKPIAVHTPLLIGLLGTSRMDVGKRSREEILVDAKMSKSRPETCILIHDPPSTIREKILKAYCPSRQVEMNPILEIAKHVVFPKLGALRIERPKKYGPPTVFHSFRDLAKEYSLGLHPLDVKMAVADALSEILSPVRGFFRGHPSYLSEIEAIEATR